MIHDRRHHQHAGSDSGGEKPFSFRGSSIGGFKFGAGSRRVGRGHFNRGDLKYVILDLLQDGPRHGYDIIRALETRFHGFYTPSPGSVYPTLQLLEDRDFVTSSELDGKRVYTITEAGKDFLKERESTVNDVRSRAASFGHKIGPEMREVIDEVRHLGQALFRQGAAGAFSDAEKMKKLKEVVTRTREEIESIFDTQSDESDKAGD